MEEGDGGRALFRDGGREGEGGRDGEEGGRGGREVMEEVLFYLEMEGRKARREGEEGGR